MISDDCPHVASVLNHAIEQGIAHFGTTRTNADEVRRDWEATNTSMPWLISENNDGEFLGFAKASKNKDLDTARKIFEAGFRSTESEMQS